MYLVCKADPASTAGTTPRPVSVSNYVLSSGNRIRKLKSIYSIKR